MKNIRMNHVSGGKYEILHPETNTGQIVDISTGKTLDALLDLLVSNVSMVNSITTLTSTVENQTDFTFSDTLLDNNSLVKVFLNGEFLFPEEYTMTITPGSNHVLKLTRQLPVGESLFIDITKLVVNRGS